MIQVNHPNLRFLVIGNKHDCKEPIADYFPSPGNTNKALALAHPWQKVIPTNSQHEALPAAAVPSSLLLTYERICSQTPPRSA